MQALLRLWSQSLIYILMKTLGITYYTSLHDKNPSDTLNKEPTSSHTFADNPLPTVHVSSSDPVVTRNWCGCVDWLGKCDNQTACDPKQACTCCFAKGSLDTEDPRILWKMRSTLKLAALLQKNRDAMLVGDESRVDSCGPRSIHSDGSKR